MERNDGVIRLLRIFHWTNMLVIGIFVVWVAGSFIHTLDQGIGYAISNALVAALISLFLVAGALWLVNLTVGNLMRSLAVRKLKEQFGNYLTAQDEPEILVIPFGEDRITAEKAQSMLQRF